MIFEWSVTVVAVRLDCPSITPCRMKRYVLQIQIVGRASPQPYQLSTTKKTTIVAPRKSSFCRQQQGTRMNECIEESILLLKLTMNFSTLARKVIQARNAQWQYQEEEKEFYFKATY